MKAADELYVVDSLGSGPSMVLIILTVSDKGIALRAEPVESIE